MFAKLKWREPREFKEARTAVELQTLSRWLRPSLVIGQCALLFPFWYLHRETSHIPLWLFLLLAAALGSALAYGIPWLYLKVPTEVKMFNRHMMRFDRQYPTPLRYADMQSFTIESLPSGHMLTIQMKSGVSHVLGVPSKFDVAVIQSFLEQKNVRPVGPKTDSASQV